jgi:hypothetical protein
MHLCFDRNIVDCKFFYPVEKHQIINFDRQIGSTIERGVSENHLIFRREHLQSCFKRLGPTLDLLVVRPEYIAELKQQEERRKRVRRENYLNSCLKVSSDAIVSSPVRNPSINHMKRSFSDMTEFIARIDEEIKLKKKICLEFEQSKKLNDILPPILQHFINDMRKEKQHNELFDKPFEDIAKDPAIELLLLFHSWNTRYLE